MLGSPLFFIFIQNLRYLPKQDGRTIEASSDEMAPPYSPSFPPFSFSLSPSSPLSSLSPLLLPSSSLSALFSLPLSAPTFSSSPSLPPRHRHFTPLFVTPFFCCGSSISFQHEPAHFSNTKDCDPVYRIPFRRLDTTLRADQSSRRPTLHPS